MSSYSGSLHTAVGQLLKEKIFKYESKFLIDFKSIRCHCQKPLGSSLQSKTLKPVNRILVFCSAIISFLFSLPTHSCTKTAAQKSSLLVLIEFNETTKVWSQKFYVGQETADVTFSAKVRPTTAIKPWQIANNRWELNLHYDRSLKSDVALIKLHLKSFKQLHFPRILESSPRFDKWNVVESRSCLSKVLALLNTFCNEY